MTHAKTEGWVAGLRLLLLATQANGRRVSLIPDGDQRSQQLLFDYLAQEVLAALPGPVHTFLLETSILSTLNAALCDAVRAGCEPQAPGSAALLRQLAEHNLFVNEIDQQAGWYRYHPQFHAVLRQQLALHRTSAEIRTLQARAASWYGDHGFITESMHAYLAAERPACAGDQLELALGELYRREKTQLLQHLLGLLPPALVAMRPALLMVRCWLAELRSQWAVMRRCVEDAVRLLEGSAAPAGPTPAATVWGEIHAARSYYLVSDADLAEQQAAAELALTLPPPDHTQGRGFALISLARIYRWQGRLPAAERLLEQALDEHGLHQDALTLRLPRMLVAALVGVALGISGAIMQGLTRNPLADPDILGISPGAGLVAVTLIVVVRDVSSQMVSVGAFAGALLAAILIYLLAWRGGDSPLRLILIGIGLGAVAGALTTLMLTFGDLYDVQRALIWLTGSVYGRSWKEFWALLPWVLLFAPPAFLLARDLNTLNLGEEIAHGLGVRVALRRVLLMLMAVALAGSTVAAAGTIASVGLMAPHIARRLVGVDHTGLLPVAGLVGAFTMVAADLIGRTLFAPIELPVGLVTAAIGAPFFIYLLWQQRNAPMLRRN